MFLGGGGCNKLLIWLSSQNQPQNYMGMSGGKSSRHARTPHRASQGKHSITHHALKCIPHVKISLVTVAMSSI